MAKIFLVRHGEASGAYTEDPDPGLSDRGEAQALSIKRFFIDRSPLKVYSSPLKRAYETAKLVTGDSAKIFEEPRMSEIPSDTQDLEKRGVWLRKVIERDWDKQPEKLKFWKKQVISFLESQTENTMIFTHFIAINAVVGHLTNSLSVVVCKPNNCSITILEVSNQKLQLISLPEEASTFIN
ncbi:histidine phosphatase family protein [Gammaproteobacteria bacterium]|nr:histidine phosphatase family protein [Gammaproteobacteria bacterium]